MVWGMYADSDDAWRRTITIEAVRPAEPLRTRRCVAGAGACPPEGCGGPAGYARLVRTLAGRMTDEKAICSTGSANCSAGRVSACRSECVARGASIAGCAAPIGFCGAAPF